MSTTGTENDASARATSGLQGEHGPDSAVLEDPEDSLVQGDGSATSRQSLCDSFDTVTTSTEKTQPSLQKKTSPRKVVRKTSTGNSLRPPTSLKRNDPLMSKFKFLQQKYKNSMQAIAQEQLSLKCMHEKLSKLRKELLDTGKYSEDDLFFNTPNVYEVSTYHCLLDDGISCGAETQSQDTEKDTASFELNKLRVENRKLAMKLSELERKQRTERRETVKNSISKVSVRPTTPQMQEYVMSKELRSKIRSRNALRLEYEKKLNEAKSENQGLQNQLQEAKMAVEELTRLNSFTTCEREMMESELAKAKESLEGKIEEAKKYEDFAELVQVSLTRLRGEYEEFQKENDSLRRAIEELKKDYGDSLAKFQEASKSWKTADIKYRKQEGVKNAIISDFVKLGVSYKKLRATLDELTRRNVELEQQAGATPTITSFDNTSSKHSQSRKSSRSKKTNIPSDCRNIAVQAVEVKSNPLSKLTAFVSKTLSSQQFSSGDKPLQKTSDDKDDLLAQLSGLHSELKAVREENARFVAKHKLLIKQLLRYEKRCHLQTEENRKHRKFTDELQKSRLAIAKSKHPEKQLDTEQDSEPAVSKPDPSRTPNPPKIPKPGGHHRVVYVVRPTTLAKTQSPKKAWLKTLWSKDSDPPLKPSLHQ